VASSNSERLQYRQSVRVIDVNGRLAIAGEVEIGCIWPDAYCHTPYI
jgi:hypothetical protein